MTAPLPSTPEAAPRPAPPPVAALTAAAERWQGTPFCPNSCVRGAGVCCHQLIGALYRESGWLPDLPALPPGEPNWARAGHTSPILDWLRGPGTHWFRECPPGQPLLPGDLLLVRFGPVPHHLALMLPEGRAVHVSPAHGVQILPVLPRRFAAAIAHIFRPLAQ